MSVFVCVLVQGIVCVGIVRWLSAGKQVPMCTRIMVPRWYDGISMVLANFRIRNKEKLLNAVNCWLTVVSWYMLQARDWG